MKHLALASAALLLLSCAPVQTQTQFPSNTLWGNTTASTGLPTTVAVPPCTGGNVLTYATGTGFSCVAGGGGGGTNLLPLNNVWTGTNNFTLNTGMGANVAPDALLTVNANTGGLGYAVPAGTNVHIMGANGALNIMRFDTFGNQSIFAAIRTNASSAPLNPDEIIFNIGGYGWDGSAVSSAVAAGIRITSGGTWSTSSHPGYAQIFATPVGSTSPIEITRFTGTGVGVNTGNNAIPGIFSVGWSQTPLTQGAVLFTVQGAAGSGHWITSTLGTSSPNQYKPPAAGDLVDMLSEIDLSSCSGCGINAWRFDNTVSAGTGAGATTLLARASASGSFVPSGTNAGVSAASLQAFGNVANAYVYGAVPLASCTVAGGTGCASVVGLEADTINTNANTVTKIAVQAVDETGSSAQATGMSAAYAAFKQSGAVGFKTGIVFGSGTSVAALPLTTGGTLFQVLADPGGSTIATGIDLTGGANTLTISGNAWASTGATLTGAGAWTTSGLTLSAITGTSQCLHASTVGVVSGTGGDCRFMLTANRTYFVSTTGNDSNNGLTSGTAFATLQHAYDVIVSTLDLAGKSITIQAASGTYTAGLNMTLPWMGGGTITVDLGGATLAPAGNAISASCILPGTVTIQNGTLRSTGANAISHNGIGTIALGSSITFGATTSGMHMLVSAVGARISALVPYTISGGAIIHMQATGGGVIIGSNSLITIPGAVTLTWYANATRQGLIDFENATWSGAANVTGTRYSADNGGIIFTGTSGNLTYFPGTIAGTPGTAAAATPSYF